MNNNLLLEIIIAVIVLVIAYKLLPIIYNYIKKRKMHSIYRKAKIRDIDKMDGIEFEYYLEALFKKLKFKPVVTKATHDFGADLILKSEHKKIVVQVKRSNSKVGIKAVQEIFAAQRYHNANEAWIVTNSFYTKSATELGSACDIVMKDRNTLSKWIIKINTDYSKSKNCPICHNELVVRQSNNGQFFGCSNYPKCKYTENI